MKTILLGAAAVTAGVSAVMASVSIAAAADREPRAVLKARPMVAQPLGWTGFYLGGNLGYAWGHAKTEIVEAGSIGSFPGILPGTPTVNNPFAASHSTGINGVIGGGQLGYNWQFHPKLVAGVEADLQASSVRGSFAAADPFAGGVCIGAVPPNICL